MLSEEALAGIIAHMNEDHPDAVLLYARVAGNRPQATAARMVGLNGESMSLQVLTRTTSESVRGNAADREPLGDERIDVALPERIDSPAAARRILIKMAQAARKRDLAAD